MRIAAIYDIHANLPALDAVLGDIHRANVERIVIGGDVLPGPMPVETLARLGDLATPTSFIKGNGEAAVLAQLHGNEAEVPAQARDVVRWVAKELSQEHADSIEAWPKTVRFVVPGVGDVLFCHATPRSDTEIFTKVTPEDRLLPVFQGLDVSTVVCGHTHMQFDRTIGKVRVVNAGSVGMPFGDPGAFWLLLGPSVELRHSTYDLEKAAALVRRTNYPHAQDFAARNILTTPAEDEMLQLFEKAELR